MAIIYSTTGIYSAKELNKIIRSHWSIENCNHYVRDVALEEDKSRIRKNSGIMARIRSFALNILRFKNKKNIQRALYENCLKANSWIRGFEISDRLDGYNNCTSSNTYETLRY